MYYIKASGTRVLVLILASILSISSTVNDMLTKPHYLDKHPIKVNTNSNIPNLYL